MVGDAADNAEVRGLDLIADVRLQRAAAAKRPAAPGPEPNADGRTAERREVTLWRAHEPIADEKRHVQIIQLRCRRAATLIHLLALLREQPFRLEHESPAERPGHEPADNETGPEVERPRILLAGFLEVGERDAPLHPIAEALRARIEGRRHHHHTHKRHHRRRWTHLDYLAGNSTHPRGFAPRTPRHALSRAASPARFRLRAKRYGETSPKPWRRRADRVARSQYSLAPWSERWVCETASRLS